MLSVAKVTSEELENVRVVSVIDTKDGGFKVVNSENNKVLITGSKVCRKNLADIVQIFNWEVTSESYLQHSDLFPSEDDYSVQDVSFRFLMQA